MALTFYNSYQQLIDDCANAFLGSDVSLIAAGYGPFRYQSDFNIFKMCPRPPYIRANFLISRLCKKYDSEFKLAARAATLDWDDSDDEDAKEDQPTDLKVPCHPLATYLRDQMGNMLLDYDGARCTTRELMFQFDAHLSTSKLVKRLNELDYFGACPQGFYIYQRLLVEHVLYEFDGLEPIRETYDNDMRLSFADLAKEVGPRFPIRPNQDKSVGTKVTFGHRELPVVTKPIRKVTDPMPKNMKALQKHLEYKKQAQRSTPIDIPWPKKPSPIPFNPGMLCMNPVHRPWGMNK